MKHFYWIDAFADGPFTGNPAGVFLLPGPAEESWMRGMAAELGLSETAFAWPLEGEHSLRWFTPKAEVRLCGHATLAAAEALLDSGLAGAGEALRFRTLSGELRAWRRKDNGLIELDFPQEEPRPGPLPEGMLAALGLMTAVASARAGEDWLIECRDEEELRLLSPDFRALGEFGGRGVCVTCKAEGEGADFASRFFAPALGIDEDPVTGSAHCYLGPWWASRSGGTDLIGRQLSRRGGLLRVGLKHGRAFLSGRAQVVLKGVSP